MSEKIDRNKLKTYLLSLTSKERAVLKALLNTTLKSRSSLGKLCRDKGGRTERELRDVLIKHGWEAERGQQRSGSPDSPDVKWNGPCHLESKAVKGIIGSVLYSAISQARENAKGPWCVCIKKDGKGARPAEWYVIQPLEQWLDILPKPCYDNKKEIK